MKEAAEHTPLRGLGIPKFAAALQKGKILMRGETMELVVNKTLPFHSEDCEVDQASVALAIAGYRTACKKVLAESKFPVGFHPILKSPLNIETVFARSIKAVESAYRGTTNIKKYLKCMPIKLQVIDGLSWRNDIHLAQYAVKSILPREEPAVVNVVSVGVNYLAI